MVVKSFTVIDMECFDCARRLEGLEDELTGVVKVEANFQNQKITVKYDESRINDYQIIEAVRLLGYTAKPNRN